MVPSLTSNLVTVLSCWLTTQILPLPSEMISLGPPPTPKVPSRLPSLARSLLTLSRSKLLTQIFSPSNAAHAVVPPAANVPSKAPSLARSLVTLLLVRLVVQILAPSNVRPHGLGP